MARRGGNRKGLWGIQTSAGAAGALRATAGDLARWARALWHLPEAGVAVAVLANVHAVDVMPLALADAAR